ncbi:MAG: alpha/beta hydrolase family protein [Bryobacteraceae bacterium]
MKQSLTVGLSRRELLALASACALSPRLRAADLPGFYYRDYSKCLPDYLSALAKAAYEKRNNELSRLTSPNAISARQRWAREAFWQIVGGRPEETPLKARVMGKVERSGYNVEKVVYESQPGIVVSANIYLPSSGKPPYPGVLFQMGHSPEGKAAISYQKCCQGLARLGYVVLAFDPMGQAERIGYPNESGSDTRLGSVDEEHNVPGKQLLLLGDTASRYQVWDAIRSLDYLASHPLVDSQRLASTGQSGGATVTMLLACVDERLSAVAVSSGNTENLACADFNPPGSTDDAEQDLIGSGPLGFDRWDLLYPMAPKPLLVLVSAHDFFGTYSPRYLSSGREEYEKLEKVYGILGHPDHLDWRDIPLPHGLTYSLRLDVYNWFERWLKNSERRIEEEPITAPETASTLWAGATGSVVRDFGSLRPFDLMKQRASTQRLASRMSVSQLLSIQVPARDLEWQTLARTPTEGARIEAIEVHSAPQVWVPAWLFVPGNTHAKGSALLVLDERGRNAGSREDGTYHRLAREGRVVCAADIRGIGDMRPEVGRGDPAYTMPHDSEDDFAWASLILGNSLLAQRVQDILAVLQAMRNEPRIAGRRIIMAARARLTVPALFAFAASSLAESLYLAGGLVSYQNVLDTEIYREPLASFGWDLFRRTDLPLLAAQAAPRRVHLAGVVDAAGNPVDLSLVRRIYSSENVHVSAIPAWDEAGFRTL